MQLDISLGLEAEIYVTGSHGDERLIGDRLLEFTPYEGVFIDVGANVGYHTLRVARNLVRSGGKVLSFEPIAGNRLRLINNVRLNSLTNVCVEHTGLGDIHQTLTVSHASVSGGNVSLASQGQVAEEIELTTLDGWAKEHELSRVDIIKLDIEGAETIALRGMSDVLERFQPTLILEINPMWMERLSTSPEELLSLLNLHDYLVFDIRYRGRFPRIENRIEYVDSNSPRETNVIALSRERCKVHGIM
jgi:FkbM family methyltransferase